MTTPPRLAAALTIALAATLALAPGAVAGGYEEGPEPPHRPKELFVSPSGGSGAPCTHSHPCKTIAEALAKATSGSTINVLGGEYDEEVVIPQKLYLIGWGLPTINALGHKHGIELVGEGGEFSLVKGFIVEHALEEGILAFNTEHVKILHNEVRENDLGNKAKEPEGQCKAFGPVPGDCGEGVHLMATTHSVVAKNLVLGNAGGILLTDEGGPTAHNVIADNKSIANVEDCGITLAGHNPEAVSAEGKPQPAKAGVYDNKIVDNLALDDGILGGGAGILLASPVPGGGVYNNLIKGNSAAESGLPGITLHSHAPGQDLNGNRFIDNDLAANGSTGNGGKPGDEGTGLEATAGIIIFSAVTKLEGIVVKGNHISKEHFGIWTKNVPTLALDGNTFSEVEVPLEQL